MFDPQYDSMCRVGKADYEYSELSNLSAGTFNSHGSKVLAVVQWCPIKVRDFLSKWELPFLPPSSLELWRKERARKAALILMKISHFDRTLRYFIFREFLWKFWLEIYQCLAAQVCFLEYFWFVWSVVLVMRNFCTELPIILTVILSSSTLDKNTLEIF